MRNFLALLGWNPGDDRELYYTIEELVDAFSLERVLKKAAIFDLQKLEWLNGQHIGHTAPEKLYALIAEELPEKGVDVEQLGMDRVLQAVAGRASAPGPRTTWRTAWACGSTPR